MTDTELEAEMARFPMRFTTTVIIGPKPTKSQPVLINTASAVIVDLGNGPVAITCQHVVKEALTRLESNPDSRFQLGGCVVDLRRQLIDQDARLDIATIALSAADVAGILSGEEIGAHVFRPVSWPPARPKEGELVAFGGFPGSLRTVENFDEIEFGTWSSGGTQVDSSSEMQFVSRFNRDDWMVAFGNPAGFSLQDLAGMSGGGVFALRGLHWDLVGVVKEYHENYDAMFFASLAWVGADGKLTQPAV
jgi:Trypsin-like peptidase domain